MKQKLVLSPEELEARRKKRELGLPVATETESLNLRSRVMELEQKLHNEALKVQDRGPTPHALRRDLDKLLERWDLEPAEELLKIATLKDDQGAFILSARERAEIWQNLMQYRMPKLRATEIKGNVNHTMTLQVVMFSKEPGREQVLETKTIDIGKE